MKILRPDVTIWPCFGVIWAKICWSSCLVNWQWIFCCCLEFMIFPVQFVYSSTSTMWCKSWKLFVMLTQKWFVRSFNPPKNSNINLWEIFTVMSLKMRLKLNSTFFLRLFFNSKLKCLWKSKRNWCSLLQKISEFFKNWINITIFQALKTMRLKRCHSEIGDCIHLAAMGENWWFFWTWNGMFHCVRLKFSRQREKCRIALFFSFGGCKNQRSNFNFSLGCSRNSRGCKKWKSTMGRTFAKIHSFWMCAKRSFIFIEQ